MRELQGFAGSYHQIVKQKTRALELGILGGNEVELIQSTYILSLQPGQVNHISGSNRSLFLWVKLKIQIDVGFIMFSNIAVINSGKFTVFCL